MPAKSQYLQQVQGPGLRTVAPELQESPQEPGKYGGSKKTAKLLGLVPKPTEQPSTLPSVFYIRLLQNSVSEERIRGFEKA